MFQKKNPHSRETQNCGRFVVSEYEVPKVLVSQECTVFFETPCTTVIAWGWFCHSSRCGGCGHQANTQRPDFFPAWFNERERGSGPPPPLAESIPPPHSSQTFDSYLPRQCPLVCLCQLIEFLPSANTALTTQRNVRNRTRLLPL